jgi:hypothetical protein
MRTTSSLVPDYESGSDGPQAAEACSTMSARMNSVGFEHRDIIAAVADDGDLRRRNSQQRCDLR